MERLGVRSSAMATRVVVAVSLTVLVAMVVGCGSADDARLDTDLAKAIDTASPSLSPEELDAHIREVTGAPYSMIVAPYDPQAEAESMAFDRTIVAGEGTDGALTTSFEGLIHDSGGQVSYGSLEGYTEPTYYAGRPIEVDGVNGYVLVAK